MSSKCTEYYFDENLRDIPSYPEELTAYVEKLKSELTSQEDLKDQVRTMGEIGVYLRQLMQLDKAEELLNEALRLVQDHSLGAKLEVQQKIRLAHVFQWKKNFSLSGRLFSEIVSDCRNNSELIGYLAFSLQHAGKDFFDQGDYKKALEYFKEALEIRIEQNVPKDQIESTRLAIQVATDRIQPK